MQTSSVVRRTPDFGGQVAPSPPLASRPATRVQFGLGAVLQYSIIPSLRAAGSEDSLPRRRLGEGGRTTTRTAPRLSSPKSCPTKPVVCRLQTPMASEVGRTKRVVRTNSTPIRRVHTVMGLTRYKRLENSFGIWRRLGWVKSTSFF